MLRKFPILVLVAMLAASGCAGKKSKSAGDGEEFDSVSIQEGTVEGQPIEAYGPAAPSGSEPSIPSAGNEVLGPPAPAAEEKPVEAPKLCLILGPGMGKAIAQAAVLEEIKKAQLPLHCIVGTDMGALVGALYSAGKGNINSLQWQLFKLNKDIYFNFPLLSLKEPKSSGKKLNQYLRASFPGKKIEDLPIKFATLAADPARGTVKTLEAGSVAEALSAALAMPEIFEPWKAEGLGVFIGGADKNPVPVDLAKKLGGNFFVLVDVLEYSDADGTDRFHKAFASVRALVKEQKKLVNFTISVRTDGIRFDEFSRQGEILSAGTRAAEAALPEIKEAWDRAMAAVAEQSEE